MSVARARALLACFLGGAAFILAPLRATADEPAVQNGKPVPAFGQDNPSCREWTDGCQVCVQGKNGSPICSTPGIACVPGSVACVKSTN